MVETGAGKLRIAEIFASIQGEGVWAGTPSVFVRVSGCNLRCSWCDTKYASWSPEGGTMAVDEIVEAVSGHGVPHVVLTGGEPMLFDAVEELSKKLDERGHTITIETAGTVFRELPCHLMSISPKLANSDPGAEAGEGWTERHRRLRSDLTPLKRLIAVYPYQLKFVVNPEGRNDDVSEIRAILDELGGVTRDRILLMPEGTDSETLRRRGRKVAEICVREGFRFCPRLHIELFGNTRGT